MRRPGGFASSGGSRLRKRYDAHSLLPSGSAGPGTAGRRGPAGCPGDLAAGAAVLHARGMPGIDLLRGIARKADRAAVAHRLRLAVDRQRGSEHPGLGAPEDPVPVQVGGPTPRCRTRRRRSGGTDPDPSNPHHVRNIRDSCRWLRNAGAHVKRPAAFPCVTRIEAGAGTQTQDRLHRFLRAHRHRAGQHAVAMARRQPSGDGGHHRRHRRPSRWAGTFYNILFESCPEARQPRKGRSVLRRIVHAVGFEAGLVAMLVPLFAWVLGVDLLTALMLNAAMIVFFLVSRLPVQPGVRPSVPGCRCRRKGGSLGFFSLPLGRAGVRASGAGRTAVLARARRRRRRWQTCIIERRCPHHPLPEGEGNRAPPCRALTVRRAPAPAGSRRRTAPCRRSRDLQRHARGKSLSSCDRTFLHRPRHRLLDLALRADAHHLQELRMLMFSSSSFMPVPPHFFGS